MRPLHAPPHPSSTERRTAVKSASSAAVGARNGVWRITVPWKWGPSMSHRPVHCDSIRLRSERMTAVGRRGSQCWHRACAVGSAEQTVCLASASAAAWESCDKAARRSRVATIASGQTAAVGTSYTLAGRQGVAMDGLFGLVRVTDDRPRSAGTKQAPRGANANDVPGTTEDQRVSRERPSGPRPTAGSAASP
jgi:hypothetical protein